MIHLVLLFLHVTSAMGIVAGLGFELLALVQLRAARTAQDTRTALTSSRYVQRVAGSSFLATIVTGIYLATVYWGWRGAWMGVALLAIIAMAIVGALMTGRPMLRALRAPDGALGATEIARLRRRLSFSYAIRLGLFVGIVFVMTTKPMSGAVALGAVIVAAGVGLLAGLPMRRVGEAVRA